MIPMTSNRAVALKFGVFVLLSLTLLALLHNSIVRGVAGGSHTYEADFSDVSGLRTGDDVRIAGVRVGAVKRIEVRGDSARVAFAIGPDHPLTSTSGLVLKYQNLIGQRYLAIVAGAPGGTALAPGALIPEAHTSPGFDLTALLNGFRPLFDVLKPSDVNKLSQSILDVLQGEGGTISSLLQETTHLTNYLADRNQLFHQVATNLVPVLQEVSGQGSQLTATVHQLSELTAGLAANRATIATSIDSMAALIGKVDDTVTQLRGPIANDVAKLQQVLHVYAATKDQYGEAPVDFGKVLGVLGRLTSYQSAANLYYCTLTAVVSGISIATDPPNATYSKLCRG